jgi:hypothetical protein
MTQSTDITLSNQSGSSYRAEHNSINQAFGSLHKGSSEPSYVVTGMMWIDDSSTPWVVKVYDGTTSNAFMEIDPTGNTFTLINQGDGDARTELGNIGQVQDGGFNILSSVAGTNTITGSLTPAITAYATGMVIFFTPAADNTGAVTINVNSVGAKALQVNGSALTGGECSTSSVHGVVYDGTQFQLINPAVLASESVTASNLDRTVNAIGSIGGGTQDIDLDSGRTVTGTVDTSTTTFTFSNPLSGSDAFDLYLTNGGSQTVNWPASVDWAGGTAPTLTSSGLDHLVFTTPDGGTTWYGYVAGLDMQ